MAVAPRAAKDWEAGGVTHPAGLIGRERVSGHVRLGPGDQPSPGGPESERIRLRFISSDSIYSIRAKQPSVFNNFQPPWQYFLNPILGYRLRPVRYRMYVVMMLLVWGIWKPFRLGFTETEAGGILQLPVDSSERLRDRRHLDSAPTLHQV
jgi:hypothetical protein